MEKNARDVNASCSDQIQLHSVYKPSNYSTENICSIRLQEQHEHFKVIMLQQKLEP